MHTKHVSFVGPQAIMTKEQHLPARVRLTLTQWLDPAYVLIRPHGEAGGPGPAQPCAGHLVNTKEAAVRNHPAQRPSSRSPARESPQLRPRLLLVMTSGNKFP